MLEEEALLGKIALKRGILTREQIKECLRIRKRDEKGSPLVAILVEKGYVNDEELATILADQRRILAKRAASRPIQKKLRESQVGPPRRGRSDKERVRVKDESVAIVRCRYCGKAVQESARRCMHCGKKLFRGGEESRVDRKRARSEFLCNLCFYPVFEDEIECPSCHAIFLKPGEGGEFKCSQCGHFVAEKDDTCPWCGASFAVG